MYCDKWLKHITQLNLESQNYTWDRGFESPATGIHIHTVFICTQKENFYLIHQKYLGVPYNQSDTKLNVCHPENWSLWMESSYMQGSLIFESTAVTSWNTVLLRSWQLLCWWRNSPHFLEPEGPLPYSQELATGLWPEPGEVSPHLPILFLNNNKSDVCFIILHYWM